MNFCTPDYKNRGKFESNIKRATAAILNRDGTVLFNDQKFDDAVEKFREAIKSVPEEYADDLKKIKNNLAGTYNGIGLAAWKTKNFLTCKENFSLAYETCSIDHPERKLFSEKMKHANAAILNDEGDTLAANSNYSDAIEKYKNALLSIPQDDDCDVNIFNADESEEQYRNNLASAYNQQGLQLLEALDFDKAKINFILAIEEASKVGDAETIEAYKLNKQKVEAFDDKKYASATIHHRDGLKLFNEKKYTAAIEEISKALEILPEDKKVEGKIYEENLAEAYNANGDLLMEQKSFQFALENYQKAIILSESNEIYANNSKIAQYEVFIQAGMNSLKLNGLEQADSKLQDAIKILGTISNRSNTSNPTKALEGYADDLLSDNKVTDAVDAYDLALQFASDDQRDSILTKRNAARLQYLSTKCEELLIEKKYEEALAMIDEALTICPENFSPQINSTKSIIINEFAVKLIVDENFEEATKCIEKTRNVKIEPDDIIDEKLAAIELCKTIKKITKLDSEPAVKSLLKALKAFRNFDCLDEDTIFAILSIFLQYNAFDQAEEFIERNNENIRKALNQRVNAHNCKPKRDEMTFVARSTRTTERISIQT